MYQFIFKWTASNFWLILSPEIGDAALFNGEVKSIIAESWEVGQVLGGN